MKIIISHDVDHISAWEHYNDRVIPKFFARSLLEFLYKYISFSEVIYRILSLFSNKWQNIEEVIAFEEKFKIPATFFIAISNGDGLKYSKVNSIHWINNIKKKGIFVGLHGINSSNLSEMQEECKLFKSIMQTNDLGIRMHCLNHNKLTYNYLNKLGYLFDSSSYSMNCPYRIGDLWEFPIQIMDSYIVSQNGKYQDKSLLKIKDKTKAILETAFKENLNYFSVLFHDRYFSCGFETIKHWYLWLIQYLNDNNLKFVNYIQAIEEMRLENGK